MIWRPSIRRNHGFAVFYSSALKALVEGRYADASHGVVESIEGVREVHIVVKFGGGRRIPSLNSSGPRRESTLFSVLMAGEIAGAVCALLG
jgi:hypothetical protein